MSNSNTATRLPNGLRAISTIAMAEIVAALREVKHQQLVEAMIAMLGPEADRRIDPMNEPAWPAIDVTDWTIDQLFRALRDCLTLGTICSEADSRGLFRIVGYVVWSEFRHRVGAEALPFDENPNT